MGNGRETPLASQCFRMLRWPSEAPHVLKATLSLKELQAWYNDSLTRKLQGQTTCWWLYRVWVFQIGKAGKNLQEKQASMFQLLTMQTFLEQTGKRTQANLDSDFFFFKPFQGPNQHSWTHQSRPSRGLRKPFSCGSALSCPVCSPAGFPRSLQSMLE